MGNGKAVLAVVVMIIGLAALAAGAIYLAVPAHSLPSFFPGHAAHVTGKHSKRGIAGLAFGAVLVIVSIVMLSTGGRRRHRYY